MSSVNGVNGNRNGNVNNVNNNNVNNNNVNNNNNDTVEISKEANELSEKEKKLRMSRYDRAERSNKADTRGLNAHGTRRGQKVEQSGKQASATEKVNDRDHKIGNKRGGRVNDKDTLKAKTEKLSKVLNGLSKAGVNSKEISQVVQKANRKLNERLGNDLKEAYKAYKDKKISGEELKTRLYETAIKKVQGVAFALKSAFSQKPAAGVNNNASTAPSNGNVATKVNDNGPSTPSFATKANNNGLTTPSFANQESSKTTPAPQQSIFAKKDDAKSASSPMESIFAKNESAQTSPAPLEKAMAKKDEPTMTEKALAKNGEKSEAAKEATKSEEQTAMEAKPAIAAKPEITETKGNIAEDVNDIVTPTTKEAVDNSALATGEKNPEIKDSLGNNGNAEQVAPGLAKKDEVPPGQVAKEEALSPGLTKLEKELKTMLNDIIKEVEKLPPGLAKKDGVPGNAEKVFGEIVGMFNEIDKMVNGLDEKADGKDEKKGFSDFVKGLKDIFSDVDGAKGNAFLRNLHKVKEEHGADNAQKLGQVQVNKEKLSQLFGAGQANSGFGVNRVGDNGEGSGNFSAVRFMANMSRNINSELESYKEVKETTDEKGEKDEKEVKVVNEANAENAATQANVEARFSALA